MSDETIAIIGSGAWGTALAQVFATAGKNVNLYVREKELLACINMHKENKIYLPNIKLHKNIMATDDKARAVREVKTVLNVVPTQFTRETLIKFTDYIEEDAFIVNCSKGIEITSLELISEIVNEILPRNPYAVLSGPTFAEEVASGLPTAVTLASRHKDVEKLAEILSGKTFRPYIANDVVGAELSAAIKNVIAIACGIVEGRGLGNNAKAAIMTRGMAEIKRIGLKMGAEAETFLGLSGIGDLTLTCNSIQSRNYSLGIALGEGKTAKEIIESRKSVAEGYYTAKAIAALAKQLEVEAPICDAVYAILYNGVLVDEVEKELMSRHLKSEKL